MDESLPQTVDRRRCRKYFDQPERPDLMALLYEGNPWEWYRADPGRWFGQDNAELDRERPRGGG